MDLEPPTMHPLEEVLRDRGLSLEGLAQLYRAHALNEAERYLDAAGSVDEPDWMYYFDEAELAAQAGACWVDLRNPTRARPLIDGALATIDASFVRDRTIYHVRSAEAYLHDSELDAACRELRAAADLAQRTGSIRSVDTIKNARRGLTRYAGEESVKALDRHLDKLVA
jgi:hypothetical protein